MSCLNRTPHLPLTSFPQSIETSQQQHEGPIKIRCVGEVPILFLGQAVIQVGYPVGLESAPTLPRWPWSGQWSDETERRSYVVCAATETSNEEERLAHRESLLQREVSPEEAPEGLRGSSEGDLATRSGDAHDPGGGAAVSGGAGAVAVGGGRGVDMGRFSYWKLRKRAERGLPRIGLHRTTGLLRAQVTRLIAASKSFPTRTTRNEPSVGKFARCIR